MAGSIVEKARRSFEGGNYYTSAQLWFKAGKENPKIENAADTELFISLMEGNFHNSASYFFIKLLKKGDEAQKRKILTYSGELIEKFGLDLFAKDLLEQTKLSDYSGADREYFLYALGKNLFENRKYSESIKTLSNLKGESKITPFAKFVSGAARLHVKHYDQAILDFQACRDLSAKFQTSTDGIHSTEFNDLKNRCQGSIGRVYFQRRQFKKASEVYRQLDKESWAWANALFEEAWTAWWRGNYNMSLGKLVTYKSPLLSYILNPEVSILRAMSFLKLCLWEDSLRELEFFRDNLIQPGRKIRNLLISKGKDLPYLWSFGKNIMGHKMVELKFYEKVAVPIVKSAEFRRLIDSEESVERELTAIKSFGMKSIPLTEFLTEVLKWRKERIAEDGGERILAKYLRFYRGLVETANQLSYVRLEILSKVKKNLRLSLLNPLPANRSRGAPEPKIGEDQFYWTFNGEFWGDEIGDYVFTLDSKCGGAREG